MWTRARNGLETHIHKVKAHTGACPGNDAADAAAVSVAKGTKQPTISEEASNESHMHHTWIGRIKSKGEKNEGTIHFASNLNKGLKDMLDPITSLGHCNKYSLYTRSHRASGIFMTHHKVSTSVRRTVVKARHGAIWNKKLAYRMRTLYNGTLAKDNLCPLCKGPDGTTHIMLECKIAHPLHINRHNLAVRMIYEYINKGTHGGSFSIVDAGAELPEGVTSQRLPTWLLPDLEPSALTKMRPDILFIPELPHRNGDVPPEHAPCTPSERSKYTVYIVEVGYCMDSNSERKAMVKEHQHDLLMQRLTDAGWNVKVTTILLGACGVVYDDTVNKMKEVGCTSTASITKLLSKLNLHAVKYAHDIVCNRRQLERLHTTPTAPHEPP